MSGVVRPRGPWIQRFSIRLFTGLLAVLVYWGVGFLVEDIASIRGPVWDDFAAQHIDAALKTQEAQLKRDIDAVARAIANQREAMRVVGDGSKNLQETIRQLAELQKIATQREAAEPVDLSESLAQFLGSQRQYQAHSIELGELTERKRTLEEERLAIWNQLEAQREPARDLFQQVRERHELRLAFFQLLVLMPLLLVGVWLVVRKRGSIYFPLFLGYGVAVLCRVLLVMHAYFPSRYFKYVLVLGLLSAVVRLLVYFIRGAARPSVTWLTRQYREAYERFLCPVCEYPIRTGPRRFLYWTRRTVNKVGLPPENAEEKPYVCPACGTALYAVCPVCQGIRHTLLPYCQHCNAEKSPGASCCGDA